MAEVLDWRRGADPQLVIRRAVRALAEGQLVAFPSETVYETAASALVPHAVERLMAAKGATQAHPLTVAVPTAAHALDWVPAMSALGRRLARRCWPGPVILVFSDGTEGGLASRLAEPVRQMLLPGPALALCVPDHEALGQTLRLLAGPLVLRGSACNGAVGATTAEQVYQMLGDELALVIDDGPSRFGQAATVARIAGNRWSVVLEGVVSTAELQRQTTCLIVFVCTGNTCRSPLAEALCKKRLAEQLGCPIEELPERGFLVLSAGMAAMMGDPAAPEAVEAARELGADLNGHASRPLTPDLAAQADYLITMTSGHLAQLHARYRRIGSTTRMLSREGDDIADPIGGEQEVYRVCAQQILGHLEQLLPELQQP